jgi:fermentation-respiration switch protein FrsA (DUF1100 family)
MVAMVPQSEQSQARTRLDLTRTQLLTPWMQYFLKYDPRPALRKVRVPVLALDGSLDLQVPPTQDLAAIDSALEQGGNRDHRTELLPGLNHLFQQAKTGSPSEYASIQQTFSPDALKIIADWITAHGDKKS